MSPGTPSSWRWQVHAELASTQDEAIEAARQGAPGRLAVLAEIQSAGRGSRGRSWVAPRGNLNLSVLLRPADAKPDPGHWAMLAGVAVFEALAPYSDALMLKWPNDVLLGGAKLGGILIESSLDAQNRLDWLVIGIGANLVEAPYLAGRPTACLPEPAPCAHEVAEAVLRQLDLLWDTDIRAAWLARGHKPGADIDVATPTRLIRGRFAGLTPGGELLLQGNPHPISSAEIFLRSAGRMPAASGARDEPASRHASLS